MAVEQVIRPYNISFPKIFFNLLPWWNKLFLNARLAEKVLLSGASGISMKFKVKLVHISQ